MGQFMAAALEEAHRGAAAGGILIGVALTDRERLLVATGRNRRIQDWAVAMRTEIDCLLNAERTVATVLDLAETRDLLGHFIKTNPGEWNGDISR